MARVLVVDAVASVREAIALVLQLDDHDVAVAASGQAALDHTAARPPDLVLIDPHLPDMGLQQFCDELRASERPVPIVVMRMHTAGRGAATCCPGAAVLDKPFTAGELLAQVARSVAA